MEAGIGAKVLICTHEALALVHTSHGQLQRLLAYVATWHAKKIRFAY